MRIGHGFDVHKFGDQQANAEITIGGVKIASDRPLLAHSDGDVLIHALCDALLGAAAMGDIGEHFPDTEAQYKDADSRVLLRDVVASLEQAGYRLINADITLVAQAPKMAPHKLQMRDNLAADLSCEFSQLNIKATTTEGLGYAGRKEGIACHAVVLLGSGS
ncbi:2-C-methyl-D-erythritol 22C4-cyclodiphosphate synthase [gamma proteobacterium IMCC2047]|nr:2-C-methyl-D-erythritol 22C4-cyclodiphosphate synthase [gamma proteobacterium IMCC2047]